MNVDRQFQFAHIFRYFGMVLSLSWLLLSLGAPAWAVPVQSVPNPRQIDGGWVSDMANLLPLTIERQLNQQIKALERETHIEIAVVTVPDTAPAATPREFATQLFKTWGIGKQGRDNGLLVLVSLADRRVEIETGYGLEAQLPKALIHNIIQTDILPYFQQQDFARGVLVGTQALITTLRDQTGDLAGDLALPEPTRSPLPLKGLWVTIVLISLGGLGMYWPAISQQLFPIVIWLEPVGSSRADNQPVDTTKCQVCQQPMAAVSQELVLAQLTPSQKAAQELGSIYVEGWRCVTCFPEVLEANWHRRIRVLNDYDYHLCPTCEELTLVQRFQELEPASLEKPGKWLAIQECVCCSYTQQTEQEFYYTTLTDEADWAKNPYYHGYGNYDSSGDSGGSFGGGDTGGGGDGGSW